MFVSLRTVQNPIKVQKRYTVCKHKLKMFMRCLQRIYFTAVFGLQFIEINVFLLQHE